MNYEDILKIICDSLRYPEFVKAFENLNQFEQKELFEEIESVLQKVYNDGYEDYEEEGRVSYDDGYSDCIRDVASVLKRFTDDEDFVKKVRKELIDES